MKPLHPMTLARAVDRHDQALLDQQAAREAWFAEKIAQFKTALFQPDSAEFHQFAEEMCTNDQFWTRIACGEPYWDLREECIEQLVRKGDDAMGNNDFWRNK